MVAPARGSCQGTCVSARTRDMCSRRPLVLLQGRIVQWMVVVQLAVECHSIGRGIARDPQDCTGRQWRPRHQAMWRSRSLCRLV